jgi:glyoxylase I family protein
MTDLEASVRFYCDIVGAAMLRPPHDSDDSPGLRGRKAVMLLEGRLGLNLNEHTPNSPDRFDRTRVGVDQLAFAAGSYEALEAWAAHLDAHAIPHSSIRDAGGVASMFDFVDPDGVQLEFFYIDEARLAGSSLYRPAAENPTPA